MMVIRLPNSFVEYLFVWCMAMADPGFPVGGVYLGGGRRLPRQLHFKKFVCQNERIWTLGGGIAPDTPPRSAIYAGMCADRFFQQSFSHHTQMWQCGTCHSKNLDNEQVPPDILIFHNVSYFVFWAFYLQVRFISPTISVVQKCM